jgi:hypothetical protein
MSERRLVILAPGSYAGMDRPALGARPDVPEDRVVKGLELESNADIPGLRRFLTDLAREGIDDYELVALGGFQGAAWEFLGFDVGETTSAAWSAINHRDEVLSAEQAAEWAQRLNAHGLFANQADADAFLQAYLESEDPDAGWGADGWTDNPTIYAVIPVQRLRRSATRPGEVLWYTVGNESSPGDPFGRVALTVDGSGAAELEHYSREGNGHWAGTVADGVLDRVKAELARAGFPNVPAHPVPGGSAMRQVELAADDHEPQYAIMTEQFGRETEGYREAFAILDSLAVQLSSGAYKGAQDTLEPSVSAIRSLET